jgi:hypothetical protein
MQQLGADDVQPALGFINPPKDIEKSGDGHFHAHETGSDGETKSVESETFQNGVQRVRAIATVWHKKTLITMFILYVALGICRLKTTD